MIINHIIKQTGNFAICISAYDLSYLQKKNENTSMGSVKDEQHSHKFITILRRL